MPSPTSTRELDDDSVALLLEAYIDQVAGPDPKFLFGVSFEALCAALYGPARCRRGGDAHADNRLWQYACLKLGYGDLPFGATWRDLFDGIGRGVVGHPVFVGLPWRQPLHWASQYGHVGVVQALLARGADVDRRENGDPKGDTALVLACKYRQEDVLDVLIRRGANVNVRYGEGDETPLMIACNKRHGRMVRALLIAKAEVNARDSTNQTALMVACYRGHLGIVQQLLDAGSTIAVYDNKGWSPFDWARLHGHDDVFDLLMEAMIRARDAALRR